MKVSELIEKLSKLDQDALVVIKCDDCCSPLSTTVSSGVYVPERDSYNHKSNYFGTAYCVGGYKEEEGKAHPDKESAAILFVRRW